MSEITLTESLEPANEARAAEVLGYYFRHVKTEPASKSRHKKRRLIGYTGGTWDAFDPSGNRARDRYRFTADDLVSLSLLSTPIEASAAHDLLVERPGEFAKLLEALEPYSDSDFALLDGGVSKDGFPEGWELESALREIPGMGRTRTSKLMA
ncbi:MAG: DUF6308 family protein, partial [Propionibacteriaceae bacterium]|nr:DUF6308 family protein [Propionibacteriaceae bacterium]